LGQVSPHPVKVGDRVKLRVRFVEPTQRQPDANAVLGQTTAAVPAGFEPGPEFGKNF